MKQRILLVEADDSRATILVEELIACDCDVVARLNASQNLLAKCVDIEADILVIDVDVPSHELLVQLDRLNSLHAMPIVIFAEQSDRHVINQAIKAGVSAYVVDGMRPHRIKSVIEVALARFAENQFLRKELADAKSMLTERTLIEQAKSIIMRQRRIDEQSAYKAMRAMAMNQNLKLQEVAKNIIHVSELLY